jgi:uncharacterized membrane protein
VLAFASGHLILVVLIVAAAIAVLLALPVAGEILFNSVSTRAERMAPRAVLLGLGLLGLGLVTGIAVLDVAGACLTGSILLGAVMKHYLAQKGGHHVGTAATAG